MSLAVECSSCGARFALSDELFDRKVKGRKVLIRCKNCGGRIPVDASGGARPELTWMVSYGEADDREMSSTEIARALASGEIQGSTLAWAEGMPEWLPITKIPELTRLLPQPKPRPALPRPKLPSQSDAATATAPAAAKGPEGDAAEPDAPPAESRPKLASEGDERAPDEVGLFDAENARSIQPPPIEPLQPRPPKPDPKKARRRSDAEILGLDAAAPAVFGVTPLDPSALVRPPALPDASESEEKAAEAQAPAPAGSAASARRREPPLAEPDAKLATPAGKPARDRRLLAAAAAIAALLLVLAAWSFGGASRPEAPNAGRSTPVASVSSAAAVELPSTSPAPPPAACADVTREHELATPTAEPRPAAVSPKPAVAPSTRAGAAQNAGPRPATKPESAAAAGAFDRAAASAALSTAAASASACRKAGDPSGTATVVVTFAPSGRVTSATLSGPPFAGTTTGGCIAATLRRATVPPFSGAKVTVTKRVVIQ